VKKKRGDLEPDKGVPVVGSTAFKLPESGLAEDILRALAAAGAGKAPGDAGKAPGDAGKAPGDAAEAPGGAGEATPGGTGGSRPAAPLYGPERVYAFVDRLERRAIQEAEEQREAPETWVTFDLADEVYALPVTRVQEVLRVTSITRVPHAPAPVRGITNLRGRVLAVVDLRVRLGLPATGLDGHSRIVVVASRDRSIGLLVDAARQVIKLLPSGVQPPPADIMTPRSDFLLGVYHLGETLVILLDVDRVLLVHEGLEMAEAEAAAAS
jgi:purine-binding chemotaxis protein CheW